MAPMKVWGMGRASGVFLTVLCMSLGASAGEPDPCLRDCRGDIACVREMIACLVQSDRDRDAVEYLKERLQREPDEPAYARLLAEVYMETKNHPWAEKTLHDFLSSHPEDCATRSWLAWAYIMQADLDLAEEVLQETACPAEDADVARWTLLRGYLAQLREQEEGVLSASREVRTARAIYPEDRALWRYLRDRAEPGWIEPVTIRAEWSLGYTSNIGAGLPTTEAGPEQGSPMALLDLWSRLVLPTGRAVRPALEFSLLGRYLNDLGDEGEADVQEGNYLELAVRPGLYLGSRLPMAFLGYRYDFFLLNAGDMYREAPVFFHEGHRGEVEAELAGGFTLFAGGGHRSFRQLGRTRWEVDGGAGWSLWAADHLHLLLALSLRRHSANNEAYDLYGGTAIAVGRLLLGKDYFLRMKLSGGMDRYPHSPPGEGGRDLLLKPGIGLWSPSFRGVRFGATYDFSRRDSTADVSYSYTEHRGLFQIRWNLSLDPWAPRVFEPSNHVPLNFGVAAPTRAGMDEERIQDLLRQDETARRGSSCVN